ncbi:helix-turn-helix domain-containing protein [Bacillus sp. SCS-151]|uniref:helix-turn-helix domain-containing protein n=1 Tax=Nanhaiella sioensis TaxID=3115293 RepID=UPI00397CAE4E
MNVKERIVRLRKELGVNQTELAKRSGLKPPAISQYESGARNPSYDALLRLANALNVSVEYLVSGVDDNKKQITPFNEVLLKISDKLSLDNQNKLLDYASYLASIQKQDHDIFDNIPISNDPKKFAKNIFNNYTNKQMPVDLYSITSSFGLEIITGDLEDKCEGVIFKKSKFIMIDKKVTLETRRKFIVATLIGHYVLPWHTEPHYYIRKGNKSTLETEDTEQMEASSFASELLTPKYELEKDFKALNERNNVSIKEVKSLADDKYQISMSSLCNRLTEYNNKKFSIIYSKDYLVTKRYNALPDLIEKGEKLRQSSKAFSFFQKPSLTEDVREEFVPSNTWLKNSSADKKIFESTIYNPDYKSTVTLLTIPL